MKARSLDGYHSEYDRHHYESQYHHDGREAFYYVPGFETKWYKFNSTYTEPEMYTFEN